MNILICSRNNEFASILTRRLKNENHEIYLLTGESVGKDGHSSKVFQKYDFSYSNENVLKIMNNVDVDIMIIAGRIDFDFIFGTIQKKSVDYITGMTNLILSAKNANVKRVIYCSSLEIFEANENEITKKSRPITDSIDKSAFAQMDTFIKSCREENEFDIDIIRFPEIYGNYGKGVYCNDFFSKMICECVDSSTLSKVADLDHMALSVKDAVQVIIDTVYSENRNEVYHIEAEICNELEIAKLISEVDTEKEVTISELVNEEVKPHFCFNIVEPDNEKLNFNPRYSIKEEVKDFYDKIKKDKENKIKEVDDNSFKKVLRKLSETTGLFLVASLVQVFAMQSSFEIPIDFYLIFVIIIGVVYGINYAMFSVVLAALGELAIIGSALFNEVQILDYQMFINVLQFTVCGVIVGLMRDNYNRKNLNLIETNEYYLEQLKDVTMINESNTYIKNIYGKRITEYKDSLTRLYNITSKLSFLDPGKVVFQTANVVSEFIETEHVAIFVSSNDSDYFRLAATTSQKGRNVGKSIRFNKDTYYYSELKNHEVYMNRDFNTDRPTYISAVYSESGEVNAIIMVWATELEQISIYQSSLVAVLSQLVERTMASAVEYEQLHFNDAYINNTRVLKANKFKEKLETYHNGLEMGLTSYTLLKLDFKEEYDIEDMFSVVEGLVRTDDFIGSDFNEIFILLANSDELDTKFVIDRFSKNEIGCNIVKKHELMREHIG